MKINEHLMATTIIKTFSTTAFVAMHKSGKRIDIKRSLFYGSKVTGV